MSAQNESTAPGTSFHPVASVDELTALFEQSRQGDVVLYLHDPFCPVSRRAYGEMSGGAGDVHIVDVSEQHDLSDTIEAVTGVRHQSPQVIVVRDAKAAWAASHSGVRLNRLLDQLGRDVDAPAD